MAYSFARSDRESYANVLDQTPDKHDDSGISRGNEVPEYLDLGFAWLSDYDKAGDYDPRENRAGDLSAKSENQYGWNDLCHTPRKSELKRRRQKKRSGLRETLEASNSEFQNETLYYGNALSSTRKIRQGDTGVKDIKQAVINEVRKSVQSADEPERDIPNDSEGSGQDPPARVSGENVLRKSSKRDVRKYLRPDNLVDKESDNPYGWKALGPTRKTPSRFSREELRETVQRNNIAATQKQNPFGWKALGPTRVSRPRTPEVNDLGRTSKNNLRKTVQSGNIAETQKENPYGWKALGPTRRVPSVTAEVEIHAQEDGENIRGTSHGIISEETQKENPYGWKVLGPTRKTPSVPSNVDNSIRISRKRTHKETLSRSRLRVSERNEPDAWSGGIRKIKQAKRLSALPEDTRELRQTNDIRTSRLGGTTGVRGFRGTTGDGNVLRKTGGGGLGNTTGGGNALRISGGGDLRGTTYDYPYAKNIFREKIPEPITLKPISMLRPEHRPTRPIQHTSTQWTNIATDYNLMNKWHDLFAKIKKKWSAEYKDPSFLSGLSGDTSFGRSEYARRLKNRQRANRRIRLIFICTAVFVVLIVAITVPVVVFTS